MRHKSSRANLYGKGGSGGWRHVAPIVAACCTSDKERKFRTPDLKQTKLSHLFISTV